MQDIICPKCKKAFKVDETGYAEILKQVRDRDYKQQLQERLEIADNEKATAVELVTSKAESEIKITSTEKDAVIKELKAKLDSVDTEQKLVVNEAVAKKDAKIQELTAKIDTSVVEQKLAITEAISSVEKERDNLEIGRASCRERV